LTNHDPLVSEMLDQQVPLRLDVRGDWAAALRLAGADRATEGAARVDKDRRRLRSRRLLAPALGVVVLVIAGAATAAGIRWWAPPWTPSAIDTKEATSLVEYTLTTDYSVWKAGDTIAIWRMPQPEGAVCVFTALASPKPTAPGTGGPNPVGGGFCGTYGGEPPAGKPIRVSLSASLHGGGYRWLIDGTVGAGSGIERLELRSATGRLPLAYSNLWFLGQLPSSSPAANELPEGGPYVVVGYDSRGAAVEYIDLQSWLSGNR
jgi:hypothetical protein